MATKIYIYLELCFWPANESKFNTAELIVMIIIIIIVVVNNNNKYN